MIRLSRAATAACLLSTALGVAGSAEEETLPDPAAHPPEQAVSGGRIIVDLADDLDLIGEMFADLPFAVGRRKSVFLGVEARTSISQKADKLAFRVRDLDYGLGLGYRDRAGWFAGLPVSVLVGQRGKLNVDSRGTAWVRFAGFGLESPGHRTLAVDPGERLERVSWRFVAGPVFDESNVEADAIVRGDVRWYPGWAKINGRVRFGLETKVDALIDGSRFLGDVSVGPAVALGAAGGRRALFFLVYQRSRNPLGIGHSAWLAGFEYAEGAHKGTRQHPPEVDGMLSFGAGEDGQNSGQFRLDLLSPSFARHWRVAFVVDMNALTETGTNELYYFYHAGVERALDGFAVGAFFYHRSNHQVDRPNDRVTSINVAEIALQTDEWYRPGRKEVRRPFGKFDGRIAAGYLLTSTFGEDRRWHLRGGVRWRAPWGAERVGPYVRLDFETGDVERTAAGVGVSPFRSWDFEVTYRADDQFFGDDRHALLLTARYGF